MGLQKVQSPNLHIQKRRDAGLVIGRDKAYSKNTGQLHWYEALLQLSATSLLNSANKDREQILSWKNLHSCKKDEKNGEPYNKDAHEILRAKQLSADQDE
jgi:hypothetical protein